MINGTCGIIKSENKYTVTIVEPKYGMHLINWEKTTEEFKKHFVDSWNEAMSYVESEKNINIGMNVLSILDFIGWMINNDKVEDRSFEYCCMEVSEQLMDEFM